MLPGAWLPPVVNLSAVKFDQKCCRLANLWDIFNWLTETADQSRAHWQVANITRSVHSLHGKKCSRMPCASLLCVLLFLTFCSLPKKNTLVVPTSPTASSPTASPTSPSSSSSSALKGIHWLRSTTPDCAGGLEAGSLDRCTPCCVQRS